MGRYPDLAVLWNCGDGGDDGGYSSTENIPWCKCGRCREQPTPEEQVCCRRSRGPCITVTAADALSLVCLNRVVLNVAVKDRNDLFGRNDNPESNQTLRHTAYRQFVLWRHGRLGAGNRIVIPSCVVWSIRGRFPSEDGQYTGFLEVSRLPV